MSSPDASFDAIAYINTPGWLGSRYGLARVEELLEHLGHPERDLRFIHVAGTNGKGSTCAFVSQVMRRAGYRTGLFTSPYIECFEERIQIDGENISSEDLRDLAWEVRELAEAMEDHPTTFELVWVIAVMYFARKGCDIVVAEVGLGGRLDATNTIAAPEVSIIARIGLDHTELLGDTLALVAGEKAGIIKTCCPVVSHPQDAEAARVIAETAGSLGCSLRVPDFTQLSMGPVERAAGPNGDSGPLSRMFCYKGKEYRTKLLGAYQAGNAATAIEAIEVLREGGWDVSQAALSAGIAQTVWPGRFEVVGEQPLVIVDGGHNPQGAQAMASSLDDALPGVRPVFIIGILGDKDYCPMIQSVARYGSAFVTVTPENPRALRAGELACELALAAPDAVIEVSEGWDDAVARALTLAGADGVVCAFGSLYSVGAVKDALKRRGIGL